MITTPLFEELCIRMEQSQARYGDFTSIHEALGVALEEWRELEAAIHANELEEVREEAIDLAAVLIRLADQCRSSKAMRDWSVKRD